jgi:hypothetical protein
MRRRLCFVIALLLVPTAAHAHDHKAAAFLGFSFADASNLPGVQFAWEQTIPANKNVTILGDVNFNAGEHENVDIKRFVYLLGARYTFAKPDSKFAPSVHFTGGSVIDDAGPQQGGSAAIAVGGAFDILKDHRASGWGVRLQAEFVVNSGKNYGKYSAGLIYRIHEP